MTKKILIQFDIDSQPSSFDSVVAIDAGVDHLLRYEGIQVTNVTPLVHGAMFTRGGDDLKNTAIFIGGSDVGQAEKLLEACQQAFFGPVRVSLMLDANGCNTTASAAVVAAARHVNLDGARAVVLGGTGPVGRRVAQLLASDGADVVLTSRSLDRAQQAADQAATNASTDSTSAGSVSGGQAGSPGQTAEVLDGAAIVIACGAAGVELVDAATIQSLATLKVAIDLNAVPPAGIEGIAITDKAKEFGHGVGYGAIGVGGLKMKTHRAAIESLFTSNDKVLDAAEIYAIAKSIG
ncbi:Bifunctional protein MdtA [Rubripirellula lacrimiformis]|uniref:Bifunctional protein MdtA n=1 Tax=Rubripirellula lacrimiformis TaxID=1930273 RepID=A0A517NI28_9BACT|nr:NAD(P)-dependent methylenetetrahydromethanopterin dehydrogenase [Rubripirellula lacrimiformis]QDT06790.1 Bifunctional protein MdtA [Rubripirellula lacrimiformis]